MYFLIFLMIINHVYGYPQGTISGSLSTHVATGKDFGSAVNNKIGQLINAKSISIIPEFPDSGRTKAVTEFESLLSKKDSAYGYLQKVAADIFQPKPIVDTIEEHEKYGNDGDKFRTIGTAIVGGFEKLSNSLNAAVNLPFEASKQIGKKITANLNAIGGKLVGL